MSKQSCIECGDAFIGRQDKKFCGDGCRSAYNNRLNSDRTKMIRNITNALRKNNRILRDLNPNGKTKVHKDDLLKAGFNFSYFTNIYETKGGKTYKFCFDQGYLPLDHDYYAIVERKAYVS